MGYKPFALRGIGQETEQGQMNFLRVPRGLSARLLTITIGFVLAAEVAVYIPVLAHYRLAFLEQRIASAQIAALSVEEVPNRILSDELERDLLNSTDVQAVVVLRGDAHMMVLNQNLPSSVVADYDLRTSTELSLVSDAFATLLRGGEGSIRVRGFSTTDRFNWVEVVMEENFLYQAMLQQSRDLLGISALVAAFAIVLLYYVLHRLVVRPMHNITSNIARFREAPEDPERTLKPSNRLDEIGQVEDELARAQGEIRQSLKQKSRLADLGMAISKIQHDLRNILATAQLSTDRLKQINDPVISTLAPRLERSIDRAVALCERTLKHGRADEGPPEKSEVALHELAEEVGLSLGADGSQGHQWNNQIPEDLTAWCDPDQMFRVLLNLGRNSIQALNGAGGVTLSAAGEDDKVWIRVGDTGRGLPEGVRDNLFAPFGKGGSTGTGLGLAIARELIIAHGGSIELESTGPEGTVFLLQLPDGKAS